MQRSNGSAGGTGTPWPVPAHTVAWSEARLAAALTERCRTFLQPLLEELDVYLDRRLVRTAAATVTALVRHRDRPQALLLSELGAYLAGDRNTPSRHQAAGQPGA